MHFHKRKKNRQFHNGRHAGFPLQGKKKAESLSPHLFVKKATSEFTQPVMKTESNFHDFGFSEHITRNIDARGYTTPSPIQEQSIPHILAGRDVIGIANTGTGKTAAFLLPMLQKLSYDRRERVLIVTPTRELALQIKDEFHAFGAGLHIGAALCIGGTSINSQESHLRSNPQIVIGTPGRLKDLIQRRSLHMASFTNVVLDEVDRMVDIGFIHDIRYLISLLPQRRQSLFFSATVTDKVKGILNQFVSNPVTISVKRQDTSANVDQDIIRFRNKDDKFEKLQNLLRQEGFEKVIVFGRTKWGVEKLNKALLQQGFRSAAIHGNKSQNQRQRALDQFKQEHLQVLLATDVASRGLDINDVTHVINYDAPATYDDYVHRIGRTGRADKKGNALTFVEN